MVIHCKYGHTQIYVFAYTEVKLAILFVCSWQCNHWHGHHVYIISQCWTLMHKNSQLCL